MFKVYTQQNCPNCLELKNLLKANNIEYTELDVNAGTTEASAAKAKMIFNDIEATPAVEFDNQVIGGNVQELAMNILGKVL
ncbi:MAG: glutaredoxin [Clostridia bacterium]|nr:glutaredoxin [Clostridia bacterium]